MDKKEIKLDITPEVAKGTYSNLVVISHSPTEILLDFAQMMPGNPNTPIRERIIMNPIHAKHLLRALEDNIHKYEENYGQIVEPTFKNHDDRGGNIEFSLDPMGIA